ncbi:MAG: hypothetical protein HZB50_16475 [Chloroflexi bacterium]|nr:hypothetical protein [Chloroflexota bacterium]
MPNKNSPFSEKFRFWFLVIWGIIFIPSMLGTINSLIIQGNRYWKFMLFTNPNEVVKIEFYSDNKEEENEISLFSTIDDRQVIENILGYMSEAEPYHRSRGFYNLEVQTRIYVVFYLKDKSEFGFYFDTRKQPDKTIYLDFVKIRGDSTFYYGFEDGKVENSRFFDFLTSLGIYEE